MFARYVDFHALQALPISCLNRGEWDMPKTIQFGNTVRATVTSQSYKRAKRESMEELLGEETVRTRNLLPTVVTALTAAGWPPELANLAAAQIARSATSDGLKTDPLQDQRTLAPMFLSVAGLIDDLAALCTKHRAALETLLAAPPPPPPQPTKGKKQESTPAILPTAELSAILARRNRIISLFGRMLAEHPASDVAGALQVAWSFTTHTSSPQPDFFTCVEEWPSAGDKGSAHLNTAFLTAGVFYRYATINLTELTHNLGDDTAAAAALLTAFTDAFITAIPKAKKNSTAPHTLPDLVYYTVRDRRPVSYAAAFERPVKADASGGHLQPSLRKLTDYARTIERLLGTRHRLAHGHATTGEPLEAFGTHHPSYEELTTALTTAAATPAAATIPA